MSGQEVAMKVDALAKLCKWPVLLLVVAAFLPEANALIDCCSSPDPFQPFKFALLTSVYGLVIYLFLSVRTKEYRSIIYQALKVTRIIRSSRLTTPIAFVLLTGVGLLLFLLAIVPVVAGGDEGGGGIGWPGGGIMPMENPFALFEFLGRVIIYSVFIMALLSPRGAKSIGVRFYQAATGLLFMPNSSH